MGFACPGDKSRLVGPLGAKGAGLFYPAIRDYLEGRLKADEFVRTVTLLDRVDVLPKIRIDEVSHGGG